MSNPDVTLVLGAVASLRLRIPWWGQWGVLSCCGGVTLLLYWPYWPRGFGSECGGGFLSVPLCPHCNQRRTLLLYWPYWPRGFGSECGDGFLSVPLCPHCNQRRKVPILNWCLSRAIPQIRVKKSVTEILLRKSCYGDLVTDILLRRFCDRNFQFWIGVCLAQSPRFE